MSHSKRHQFTVGLTSILLLNSCRPLLSSHGETHSPYQPQIQKQNTQSANPSVSSATPKPSTTAGPAVPPQSPNPATTNPDLDKSLSIDTKLQILKLTFSESFKFPYDKTIDEKEFDSSSCRSIRLQAGQFSKEPDQSHFSCNIHYCVQPSANPDTHRLFNIARDTTYFFKRFNTTTSGDGISRASFQLIDGGSDSGRIDQINCDGLGGSLTVRDLIDSFGGGATENSDVIDVRILPITSLFSPPQAPQQETMPQALNLMNARKPASVPAVSEASRPEPSNERTQIDLPNFALQVTGSASAFGGSTISPAQQGIKSGAMLLQFEYQPSFSQQFGILSIGPSFGTYPTLGTAQGNDKVTPGFFAIMGVGGQARYQLHYFDDQLIVPYASYEAQSLSYRINGGGSGRLTVAGGSGGLSLLLNRLAPGEASDFRQSLGISRSYLVVEGKYLYGSDQNVHVSGTSVFFGLRFER